MSFPSSGSRTEVQGNGDLRDDDLGNKQSVAKWVLGKWAAVVRLRQRALHGNFVGCKAANLERGAGDTGWPDIPLYRLEVVIPSRSLAN